MRKRWWGKIAVVKADKEAGCLASSINDDSTRAGCPLLAPARIFHHGESK